ncbi:hypothetical protein GLW05_06735 [Pontibacillus yanchengensis]|uniref:Uncharacterized protein n=1 Tax=Pontibacillus yanchengensis TaxID=462910 RepID=A0A6I4ZSV2_9BACI|nr:hypothetical protein [Pontibacillus yanchengensis]MYL33295.1 hypothetical protein [Pontibacillus yanchengensis]
MNNQASYAQEQSQSQTAQLETNLADVEQQQLELLKGKTVLKDIVNPIHKETSLLKMGKR